MKLFLRDCALFFLLGAIYFLGRAAIIAIFGSDYESDYSMKWLATCLRFDAQTAIYLTIPSIAASICALVLGERAFIDFFKKAYATFAMLLSMLIVISNICFFAEYKSQFNDWIMGFFLDDTKAILGVMWKDYPIIWISIAAILACVAFWHLQKYIFNKTKNFGMPKKLWSKFLYAILSIGMIVFIGRGMKLSGQPLGNMDRVVGSSKFLNNLTATPAFCIQKEIQGYLIASTGKSLKDLGINPAELSYGALEIWGGNDGRPVKNLDAFLERKTSGAKIEKPDHIFFIVGESHSSYPYFNEKYRHLMPETIRLSKNALYTFKGISASWGTIATTGAIGSGLPFSGTVLPSVSNLTGAYTITQQMKELGYTTNFYYAGPMTWHKIGRFMQHCGFDNLISCEDIVKSDRTVFWGAYDHEVADYIIESHPSAPSFNVILTVSNHPPYDVDVAKFSPPQIDDIYQAHAWYADMCIGKLVDGIRKKYPNSLFIITGDHPSRIDVEDKSLERESYVPILFAGKPIEDANLAGELDIATHMDIAPTILELIAPKGMIYHTWGRDLSLSPKSQRNEMNPFIIYSNGVLYQKNSSSTPPELVRQINMYQGLSRWRTFNGTELP